MDVFMLFMGVWLALIFFVGANGAHIFDLIIEVIEMRLAVSETPTMADIPATTDVGPIFGSFQVTAPEMEGTVSNHGAIFNWVE